MASQRCMTSHTCPTCTTAASVEAVEHPGAEIGFDVLRIGDCSTTAGDSAPAEKDRPILESHARIDWLLGAALG